MKFPVYWQILHPWQLLNIWLVDRVAEAYRRQSIPAERLEKPDLMGNSEQAPFGNGTWSGNKSSPGRHIMAALISIITALSSGPCLGCGWLTGRFPHVSRGWGSPIWNVRVGFLVRSCWMYIWVSLFLTTTIYGTDLKLWKFEK